LKIENFYNSLPVFRQKRKNVIFSDFAKLEKEKLPKNGGKQINSKIF